MDIFVKFNKRRTIISLESKSNEDTEIVIEKFLDYLKSSNLSNASLDKLEEIPYNQFFSIEDEKRL